MRIPLPTKPTRLMALILIAFTTVAIQADPPTALQQLLQPGSTIPLPAPATQPAIEPASGLRSTTLPPGIAKPTARATLPPVAFDTATSSKDIPAIIPLMGQPTKMQFAGIEKSAVQPASPIVLKVPNLLQTPRRAAMTAGSPSLSPASPITTPSINNMQGTSELSLLKILGRIIPIEIAPPPAPLSFDQPPLLQLPGLRDDTDPPLPITDPPAPQADNNAATPRDHSNPK